MTDPPRDPKRVLAGNEIDAMGGLADWRQMIGVLQARFRLADFRAAIEFVNRIADAAEEKDHHPDMSVRYRVVDVRLVSHDSGGITIRDVELARTISSIAAELHASAEPQGLRRLELALDTWDEASVKPFWRAVLDLAESDSAELVDPDGALPTVWFQPAEVTTNQRWHLDIYVPPEQVRSRIDAALAAGGSLVSDERAPGFTVLADPQGNRVCVCTHLES